jgi:hypothetical protein
MTDVVMAAAKIDLTSEMVTRVKSSEVGGGYFICKWATVDLYQLHTPYQ